MCGLFSKLQIMNYNLITKIIHKIFKNNSANEILLPILFIRKS